jgi:hypothetical protein
MKEIHKKLSKGILNKNEVNEILGDSQKYPFELIEKISIDIAEKYLSGEIDYLYGDNVMNNLYSYWTSNQNYFKNYGFGKIAFECYEAFDNGEYLRKRNKPNDNPTEFYTKPLIKELLDKINNSTQQWL